MPSVNADETSGHRKLPVSEIGVNAPRGCCTDIAGIVLFITAWGLMVWLATIAYKEGDLNRLLYGVDYLGNVCSQGTPSDVTPTTQQEWSQLAYLYYPVTFNPKTRTFNTKDALQMGVCVKNCPGPQDLIATYSENPDKDLPKQWVNLFNTSAKYHRCIPSFDSFICNGTNSSDPEYLQCMQGKSSGGKVFNQLLSLRSVAKRGMTQLQENWWIIFVCIAIAIVLAFLWLFCLRRMVKPMVVLTIVFILIALAGVGYFLFWNYQKIKAQNIDPTPDSQDAYFYGAIAVWVATFIYLCIVGYVFRDVMVACDIIEEASKIPVQMPTMMTVPLLIVVLVIPFIIFWIFTALFIYTSAKKVTVTVTNEYAQGAIMYSGATNSTSWNVENWRPYAQVYNVFVFLWTFGFLNAIGFLTLAMCAVFWYWSYPGDNKKTDHGVLMGLKLTFVHHLGTLALGSMIVAIIQVIRLVLTAMESQMKNYTEKSETLRFVLWCAHCCLAYLERVVKFINKNAYIVCAMTGEGFFPAAKHALQLLVANALSVGAVTIIGEYVMFFGKLFITAVAVASCYGIMVSTDKGKNIDTYEGIFLVLIIVGVFSFFIAAVFINVFGVCIDSVLLSYCYDLEQHNGADKPYYFPDDLAKHVDKAMKEAEKKKKKHGEALEQALKK